jgi:hypothetical protein
VVKVGLTQGEVTINYFTYPFNPAHVADVKPGFSWHAGGAQIETTRALEAGGAKIAAGKYSFSFQKTEDGWALGLANDRAQQAMGRIRQAAAKKDDAQVKELQAKLDEEIKSGEAVRYAIPLKMVKADDEEHLNFRIVTLGYVAKGRRDATPVGGTEFAIHADFGTLHGRLDLKERFEGVEAVEKAPAKADKQPEKTEKTEKEATPPAKKQ